jgi:hypothetical protein
VLQVVAGSSQQVPGLIAPGNGPQLPSGCGTPFSPQPQPSGLSTDTIVLLGAVTLAGGGLLGAASYGIYRATQQETPVIAMNKVQTRQTSRVTPLSSKLRHLSEGESHPNLVPDVDATSSSAAVHPSYIWKATPVRPHDGKQDEALDDGERVDLVNADPVALTPIMRRFGEADFADEALGKEPADIEPQDPANPIADPAEDLPVTQHGGNDGPTLTTLDDYTLHNIFSHIWGNRYNKSKLQLVNKRILSSAYDYERSIFFKHTHQLSEACKIPRDKVNTRLNANAVYEHKTSAINNIPRLSGDKKTDDMIEIRIGDLVDLCIKEDVRATLERDLKTISFRLNKLGRNTEFIAEKLYLHDLNIFVNYVKNSWNDHYKRHLLPSYRNIHIQGYLRSMSPKLRNMRTYGTGETERTIAQELLDRIPSHFSVIQKSEVLDKLEDAFKAHYSEPFYKSQNWEDTEFGVNLRHVKTENDVATNHHLHHLAKLL